MRKKSQAQQVFVFILAIIIAALIFIYGYGAIRDFMDRSDQISLIRFQTEIQSSIRTTSADYGSVKKVELTLPSRYEKVCFVDYDKFNTQNPICSLTAGQEKDYNPLICDAWESRTQNIFTVPVADETIKTMQLEIDEGYLCVKTSNGRIVLRLEGRGDRAALSEWR